MVSVPVWSLYYHREIMMCADGETTIIGNKKNDGKEAKMMAMRL